MSERRAARLVDMPRGTMRYQTRRDPQEALRLRLRELAASRVRYGYRRLTVLLKREGFKVNAKRVYRLYKEEGLIVRTKARRKLASLSRVPLGRASRADQRWSMDFIHERTEDGRSFRVLSVIDQFTRECVALVADRHMTGSKVATILEHTLSSGRHQPESITTDNGSEFVSKSLDAWALKRGIKLDFIRPGKPVENGFVESFHGRLRDECLNAEVFFSRDDAQRKLNHWRDDYNHHRPHSALADRTPHAFAELCRAGGATRFALPPSPTAGVVPTQGSATPADAALDLGPRQLVHYPSRGRSAFSALEERPHNQSSYLESPDTLKAPSLGLPKRP